MGDTIRRYPIGRVGRPQQRKAVPARIIPGKVVGVQRGRSDRYHVLEPLSEMVTYCVGVQHHDANDGDEDEGDDGDDEDADDLTM